MTYLIKLEKFEGPLDLLLHLVEQEELSITEVSLARVTDDYLRAIRAAREIAPDALADFLVIAAKLILIKSRVLLPGLQLEEEESPLEDQLKLYREFLEASRTIEGLIKKKRFLYGRARPLIEARPEFSPPPRLTTGRLAEVFRSVLKNLEPFFALPRAAIERVISIQEKIAHLRSLIIDRLSLRFDEILRGAKSKTEAIVSFLALLELVKQRVIKAEQGDLFREITLHKL